MFIKKSVFEITTEKTSRREVKAEAKQVSCSHFPFTSNAQSYPQFPGNPIKIFCEYNSSESPQRFEEELNRRANDYFQATEVVWLVVALQKIERHRSRLQQE